MAHSWYFVPSCVKTSLEYPARTSATAAQGSVIVRNGFRIRIRSSLANTAGRSVNATISGTAEQRPGEGQPRRPALAPDQRVPAEPGDEREQQHTARHPGGRPEDPVGVGGLGGRLWGSSWLRFCLTPRRAPRPGRATRAAGPAPRASTADRWPPVQVATRVDMLIW